MGWDDRPPYRDRSVSVNPLVWILNGSIPMFTILGVRVRAHVSMLLFVALMLLPISHGNEYTLGVRAMSMGMLLTVILIHELAHCTTARRLGGDADEVVIWPLGGMALPAPPNRALPTFLTAAVGPAVNFFIAVFSAAGFYLFLPVATIHAGTVHAGHLFNPFHPAAPPFQWAWSEPSFYFWWLFTINYAVFLMNLLPIFPLDGSQMFHAILWPAVGHFRSMMIATAVGIAGSAVCFITCLATGTGTWILPVCFAWAFFQSLQARIALRENAPEDWSEAGEYASGIGVTEKPRRRRRLSRGAIKRARKIALKEKETRDRIDLILAKVSARGLHGLTWLERRALRKATERTRRSELELSRFQ